MASPYAGSDGGVTPRRRSSFPHSGLTPEYAPVAALALGCCATTMRTHSTLSPLLHPAMIRTNLVALLFPALAVACGSTHTLVSELVEGTPMYTVLPVDAIPAIDAPTFATGDEAAALMRPGETVLGVVGADGTAKAYSTWHLDSHEIVNDVLDGDPIAATW